MNIITSKVTKEYGGGRGYISFIIELCWLYIKDNAINNTHKGGTKC